MYKEWHKEYHGLDTLEHNGWGFVTYSVKKEKAYLYDLFILREVRDQGVAYELLSNLKKHFKELGVTQVYFDVQKWNTNKQYVFRIAQSLSEDKIIYSVDDKYMVNL